MRRWWRRAAPPVAERLLRLRVRRSDSRGASPRWQTYLVTLRARMSVLDALFEVLEQQDPTLAFRYSCRAQMCGSCAVRIDGREALACGYRLDGVGPTLTVEPLRNLPVIRDLVVDMGPFFSRYSAVAPQFTGDGSTTPAQLPPASGRRDAIDQHLGCISCGACFSACPIVTANPKFLGPAALNRAFTLVADVRETAGAARLGLVAGEDGIFSCRCAASCVEVCPVDVAPLFAIQRLRRRAAGG